MGSGTDIKGFNTGLPLGFNHGIRRIDVTADVDGIGQTYILLDAAAIPQEDIHWLGFDWGDRFFYGSDYFDKCYEYAEKLILEGKAYVDDLTRDEMRDTYFRYLGRKN